MRCLLLALLLLVPMPAMGSTVTLVWDPYGSEVTNCAGYRVYYGANPTAPFAGLDAVEGRSPIWIAGCSQPSIVLHGLNPDVTNYMVVAGVTPEGAESSQSSLVTLLPSAWAAGEVTVKVPMRLKGYTSRGRRVVRGR